MGEIFSPGDEKNNYLEFDTDKTISVSTMSWNPGGNGAAAASLPLFKVLWYGDLAFEGNRTKGHPYGKLVINDIGAGIMSSRFRTLTARQAPCVSFWKFFLLNDAAFRPIYINCTKRGTLMTELVVPELLRSNVVLPSEAEQSLIGAYFRQLEHLITLHQRKCQYRGLYGYLSWEQRKLGELGFAQSGIGFPDAEQGGTEGTPFFKVSDMNTPGNEYELVASNNYVTAEQIACMGWHPIVQVPAIFFAKVGAAVMLNRKRLVNKPFLLDNNTMAFSMDSSLLNTQFGQSLFERLDLTSLIQVGALPSYSSSDIEGITVSLPSTMDEQRQIGQCLCRLNTLITLHQ